MPLVASAAASLDLRLCKPKFLGVAVISDMGPLKIYLILEYEIPFVFDILWSDFVLNMRHINGLSLSLEISNLVFCKYASKYLTRQHSNFILEM